MYDCLLGMTARTVPDGTWRTEVVDVARDSSSRDGQVGRLRELAGVVTFGLRLRSVRATAGRPAAAWAQGTALGAVLVLTAALALQLDDPAGSAAAGTAAALLLALAGRPTIAVLSSATGLALTVLTSSGDTWSPTVAALVVSTVALAFAARSGPSRAARVMVPGGWIWAVLVPVACVPLVVEGSVGAIGVLATLVVPVGLVVVGGADARLAVAAAIAWSWRFVAVDPADVVDALAGLRSPELPVLLVRLAGMAWGVGVALAVAHRSNRRAATL